MQNTRHASHGPRELPSTRSLLRRLRSARLGRSVLLVASLSVVAGCAGPAIRSQSPEVAALIGMESDIRLVADYAAPWGTHPQRIERAALVTGLPGTGSDPPPGTQRALLMADMQARGVAEPNKLLASPTTSLVWVHGYLPPGVRKGDRFDVMVEVPTDNETTSLSAGWLMETRLAEMAILGQRVRDGHVLGIAEGPLLVDPVSGGTLDSKSKLRARVPGGGVSLTTRSIGLIIAPEHRSIALSKRVGDTINRRFHAVIKGTKRGVATPKTERFIDLEIAPAYEHNLARYIRVIRAIAVVEPPAGRHARMELLDRQLADPVTAPAAALKLEAIGRDALPILKKGLESSDAEVRCASAEALAYLGESSAAPHLAEAATNLRSARPAALAALQVLDDANGIDALQSLLASSSAETRYGAFRALWKIDPTAPLIRGERLGDACSIHLIDVAGPPLVHCTRSTRPEIVLFGTEHPLDSGLRAEAGSSIVVVVDGGTATINRFVAGEPDQVVEVAARVDTVARAIIQVGGTYPDVVQFLQQASAGRCLSSRLAFDAVPNEFDGRTSIHDEATSRDREDEEDEPVEETDQSGDTATRDAGRGPGMAAGEGRASASS
jgi:flagellar basal body P-ring protein FlgI